MVGFCYKLRVSGVSQVRVNYNTIFLYIAIQFYLLYMGYLYLQHIFQAIRQQHSAKNHCFKNITLLCFERQLFLVSFYTRRWYKIRNNWLESQWRVGSTARICLAVRCCAANNNRRNNCDYIPLCGHCIDHSSKAYSFGRSWSWVQYTSWTLYG